MIRLIPISARATGVRPEPSFLVLNRKSRLSCHGTPIRAKSDRVRLELLSLRMLLALARLDHFLGGKRSPNLCPKPSPEIP